MSRIVYGNSMFESVRSSVRQAVRDNFEKLKCIF